MLDKVELFNTTGHKISEYLNTTDINISNFFQSGNWRKNI